MTKGYQKGTQIKKKRKRILFFQMMTMRTRKRTMEKRNRMRRKRNRMRRRNRMWKKRKRIRTNFNSTISIR